VGFFPGDLIRAESIESIFNFDFCQAGE